MSRNWNGEDLVDEISALLGDTSAAFQSKVLAWGNDGVMDIGTRFDWGYYLTKGKKKVSSSDQVHSLEVAAPGAPTVTLAAGGSLTADSVYKVLVTFGQANDVESLAGTESASVTPTGANLTINLSAIPVSTESLVSERHLYLSKDGAAFYYHSTIANNSATTASITSDTTSTAEAPDYDSIRKLKGHPFLEEGSPSYLMMRAEDQIRLSVGGALSGGTPEYFCPITQNSILLYPVPSSTTNISFNYYRNPFRFTDSEDSQPDLPVFLKPVLKAYMIAMGYEYSQMSGQENKRQLYENMLQDAIMRFGRIADVNYQVRDVYGFNGFEVN